MRYLSLDLFLIRSESLLQKFVLKRWPCLQMMLLSILLSAVSCSRPTSSPEVELERLIGGPIPEDIAILRHDRHWGFEGDSDAFDLQFGPNGLANLIEVMDLTLRRSNVAVSSQYPESVQVFLSRGIASIDIYGTPSDGETEASMNATSAFASLYFYPKYEGELTDN